MLAIVCSVRITAWGHPARSKSDPLGWRAGGGDRRKTVVNSRWRAACARKVLAQQPKCIVNLGETNRMPRRIAITQNWNGFHSAPEINGEGFTEEMLGLANIVDEVGNHARRFNER